MLNTYQYEQFAYVTPPDLSANSPIHYPIVVIGAGPVGLTTAIDLAKQGKSVLLLDNDNTVSQGSRGVCYAKRTLEILDRLGCDNSFVNKGTSWDIGRTFFDETETFHFNLRPQIDHNRPGMVNLQQYYLEEFLIKKAKTLPNLEMRFLNTVTSVIPADENTDEKKVTVQVTTQEGNYSLTTEWLVVADGARSPIRRMMGLDIEGKIFQDRFLIADIVMEADYPAERWFWFDPPFHRNQSVLLHKQADNVWRVDFQLGWDADPQEEQKPENVLPRLKAMLGDRQFELEWVSVYTFQCRQMNKFNHGRILFAGDSVHQVSPFGARGANGGIQDADNLVWKLNLIMDGKAPASLLDSYSEERGFATQENIMNSTRSTDFITPKTATSKTFRNAVLQLSREMPFARSLVNSGRLSVPCWLINSSLNTPDTAHFEGNMLPGAPMDDAPLQNTEVQSADTDWLLHYTGNRFVLMYYTDDVSKLSGKLVNELAELQQGEIPIEPLIITKNDITKKDLASKNTVPFTVLIDSKNRVAERYNMQPDTVYLLRPDQHVAARWRAFDKELVKKALAKATGNTY